MNIAFVSTYNAKDPSLWAGTTYHMAKALEAQGGKLIHISPLRERYRLYYKARQIIYKQLGRGALQRDREPSILDGYARQIESVLARSNAQLVFSAGSIAISHLKTPLPVVFWADGTYQAIIDSYVYELPPSKRSRRLGNEQEKKSIKKATLAIYSSDWAAQSAINTYSADPSKVKVVPFGANIAESRAIDDIKKLIISRPKDRCKMLFIGTGWQRKGGDTAVEVARMLNERGVPTELHVMGSDAPPQSSLPDFVKRVGFIDKSDPQGKKKFDALFGSSHFLIHPARAEASAIVLCEAGSYGVPVISTNVGGTPTIIRNGVNGVLFPPEDAAAMADAANQLIRDAGKYHALAIGAFGEYHARLNWTVAGQTVMKMLELLVR